MLLQPQHGYSIHIMMVNVTIITSSDALGNGFIAFNRGKRSPSNSHVTKYSPSY